MEFYLDRLRLQNFRCFSECAVTFEKKLTVLIADNGRGKTAILDAAAIVLAQFVDELTDCRQSDGIAKSDVRLARNADSTVSPRSPTRLDAASRIKDAEVAWTCERKRYEKQTRRSPNALSGLLSSVRAFKADLPQTSDVAYDSRLPLIAYYASTRFSHNGYFGGRRRTTPRSLDARFDGYRDFLNPLADSRHFNDWYEQKVTAVRTHVPTGASVDGSPFRQLAAIHAAVKKVLEPTGWETIDWDQTNGCVVAEHPVQGRLPLAALSSGVRNMVALTADLAHRCARLNASLGEDAAHGTAGVVLIDEVDLHLHPAWQQRVVGLLRDAFPAIQFILSTHSPQVLSTVDADSIRMVSLRDGEGQVQKPRQQTRGVESADILAKVMEVDPIPHVEEAKWLSDYRAYVQNGQHETTGAQELWAKLVDHFGEAHPVLSEVDVLRRLQEFKRDNDLPLGVEAK